MYERFILTEYLQFLIRFNFRFALKRTGGIGYEFVSL